MSRITVRSETFQPPSYFDPSKLLAWILVLNEDWMCTNVCLNYLHSLSMTFMEKKTL